MKITSLEEYGLRCLVQVAHQQSKDPVSAQLIAEREGLSVPYAQKLLRILSQGELIESRRGAQGGYVLARPVDEITLGDAMRVLGGVIELEHVCGKHTGEFDVCSNHLNCSIRPVWSYLSEFIVHTFDSVPLALLMHTEDVVIERLSALVPAPVRT